VSEVTLDSILCNNAVMLLLIFLVLVGAVNQKRYRVSFYASIFCFFIATQTFVIMFLFSEQQDYYEIGDSSQLTDE
jgi:hypothetical protein